MLGSAGDAAVVVVVSEMAVTRVCDELTTSPARDVLASLNLGPPSLGLAVVGCVVATLSSRTPRLVGSSGVLGAAALVCEDGAAWLEADLARHQAGCLIVAMRKVSQPFALSAAPNSWWWWPQNRSTLVPCSQW